jgi:hypothetical protein
VRFAIELKALISENFVRMKFNKLRKRWNLMDEIGCVLN